MSLSFFSRKSWLCFVGFAGRLFVSHGKFKVRVESMPAGLDDHYLDTTMLKFNAVFLND